MMRLSFSMAVAALCGLGPTLSAQAKLPDGCNTKYANNPEKARVHPYGSRDGKWCEGVYINKVSAIQLHVESFTEPFAIDSGIRVDTLEVHWAGPAKVTVHLFAQQAGSTLKDRYQLDVVAVTGEDGTGRWKWPTDILRALKVWPVSVKSPRATEPPAITVQAWAVLGPADTVYIPVRIVPRNGDTSAREDVQVVMRAKERVAVRSVQLQQRRDSAGKTTWARVDPRQGCRSPTGGRTGNEPLTVWLCMPSNAATGVYRFLVGATADGQSLSEGEKAWTKFYFKAGT